MFSTFDVTQGDTQNDTQGDTQGGTQDVPQEIELDVWIEDQIRKNSKVSTEELAKLSNRGVATIKRHISKLPHIKYIGSGYSGHWEIECMQERGEETDGIKLLKCAGGSECKKALTLLKNGKLQEDFIEGMVCPGGCVGGPSRHKTEAETMKARNALLAKADGRKVLENLTHYPMEKFSMCRDGHME